MKPKRLDLRTLLAGAVLILAVLACDLPIPSLPAPYDVYVAATGNDSNDCRSVARACRTVLAAVGKAVNGSNIIVGAGTFSGSFVIDKIVTVQGAGLTRTILTRPDNTGPVVAIAEYMIATLTDMTIRGGYQDVELRGSHSQLIANNIALSTCQMGISNSAGGRVQLNNVTISACSFGIENNGVLVANTLTIQSMTQVALANNGGVATLDTVTMQQNGSTTSDPQASAAIINSVLGSRSGRITMTRGTIANNAQSGIFNSGGTLEISNSSIASNRGVGIGNSSGSLTLADSVVRANGQAGVANGVLGAATLDISRSAIIQNAQQGLNIYNGSATITNSTFSGNRLVGIAISVGSLDLSYSTVASNPGIGLSKGSDSTITLRNSIVALNATAPNCQVYGSGITFGGPNLACDETLTAARLRLGALGPAAGTYVVPLQAGSPAIDAATGTCPANDQRSYVRPAGAACDLGAFEFGAGLHLEAATPGIEAATETLPVLQIITDTPSATETPTAPAAPLTVFNKNANCRRGPGLVYDVVTSFVQGQQVQADGRSDDQTWLYVLVPNTIAHCWVGISTVDTNIDLGALPVIPTPPTPTVTPKPGGSIDFDKDGYPADKDCNDKDAKIHPGAAETAADGVDSNCNGDDNK